MGVRQKNKSTGDLAARESKLQFAEASKSKRANKSFEFEEEGAQVEEAEAEAEEHFAAAEQEPLRRRPLLAAAADSGGWNSCKLFEERKTRKRRFDGHNFEACDFFSPAAAAAAATAAEEEESPRAFAAADNQMKLFGGGGQVGAPPAAASQTELQAAAAEQWPCPAGLARSSPALNFALEGGELETVLGGGRRQAARRLQSRRRAKLRRDKRSGDDEGGGAAQATSVKFDGAATRVLCSGNDGGGGDCGDGQPQRKSRGRVQSQFGADQVAEAASSLMLDLNFAATRLAGTCASSWRQALQPNHFTGSYEVAGLAGEPPASAAKAASGGDGGASVGHTSGRCNRVPAGTSCKRVSRPGRSPVSLQRQTNARLARHKQQIQQQRQEQLASLALREREQVRQRQQHSQLARSQQEDVEAIEVLQITNESSLPNRHEVEPREANRLSAIVGPFLARLGGGGGSGSEITSQRAAQVFSTTTSPENENRRRDLEQETSNQSVGIEIGPPDGGEQQGRRRGTFSASNSVVVYRSIDLLRNGSARRKSARMRGRSSARAAGNQLECQLRREAGNGDADDADEIENDADETKTICSSVSSTFSLNRPFCKICHVGASKGCDKLISPCKCSGTMQYIHCGCLLKWLEISNRANEKPMSCELCAHEYTWHKRFNYNKMRFPKCSLKDLFLHSVFVLALLVMLLCALAPIFNRIKPLELATPPSPFPPETTASSRAAGQYSSRAFPSPVGAYQSTAAAAAAASQQPQKFGRLAQDEKFILICAASFFVSFFLAIYVQTKARDTLYGLIVKFVNMNLTYYITEYNHEAAAQDKQVGGGGNGFAVSQATSQTSTTCSAARLLENQSHASLAAAPPPQVATLSAAPDALLPSAGSDIDCAGSNLNCDSTCRANLADCRH